MAAAAKNVGSTQAILTAIEKSQIMAGHSPSAEDLDRAARLLDGRITVAEGFAELDSVFAR